MDLLLTSFSSHHHMAFRKGLNLLQSEERTERPHTGSGLIHKKKHNCMFTQQYWMNKNKLNNQCVLASAKAWRRNALLASLRHSQFYIFQDLMAHLSKGFQ